MNDLHIAEICFLSPLPWPWELHWQWYKLEKQDNELMKVNYNSNLHVINNKWISVQKQLKFSLLRILKSTDTVLSLCCWQWWSFCIQFYTVSSVSKQSDIWLLDAMIRYCYWGSSTLVHCQSKARLWLPIGVRLTHAVECGARLAVNGRICKPFCCNVVAFIAETHFPISNVVVWFSRFYISLIASIIPSLFYYNTLLYLLLRCVFP